MFRRAKNFLADVLQQADMILLALCCAATLFGITMSTAPPAICRRTAL